MSLDDLVRRADPIRDEALEFDDAFAALREEIVARPVVARTRPPRRRRWLVPPAALAIHLCIGMAYGFSVFWLPLSRAIGITSSAPDDWKISTLGWMFTLFFVMLGSSAALFGPWVEREGPHKAGVVAACGVPVGVACDPRANALY